VGEAHRGTMPAFYGSFQAFHVSFLHSGHPLSSRGHVAAACDASLRCLSRI
jgi:hypothetical protein